MKRPGITAQLFLAVFAVAALLVLALGAAAQWSFERNFIGYLNDQAVARMDAVLPRLQQAYATHGDWEFVRERPDVWFDLVGLGPRHGQLPTGQPPAREMVASDLLGAARRMTLLDAQRQHLIGFPPILAGTVQREIVVDGRTAGWLAIAPVDAVTDDASLRFLKSQQRLSLVAALLALAAAGALAWWVARTLLAPVRDVARATHRLAGGAYDTRVAVRGHDEVAQLAQDFNRLALALEGTERMRRDYMADVSHELRTPLAVLRGELEAMEDGVHPPTPQSLAMLKSEVVMLGQLVDDLHELALADVGALSYRKADLDLLPLLQHEGQLLQRACAERGLTLELDLPAAPVRLLADEGRLRQLLHNVMGNAVRYTDPGGIVRVRLHTEGGEAQLDVMDGPPGVPDEMLPRLLHRFFRAEGSRGRAGGGSGLGLAICQSIVVAHEGRIEARHSPLGGVWIAIGLPLLRVPARAVA